MYAVIQTGGKQYRVQPGDIFQVEKLDGEVGAAVNFDQVLFAAKSSGDQASQVWLGKPLLSGAAVQGEIVGQGRGDKIVMVKMKRRKQYRRTQGHRQYYTQILVTGVSNGSGEKAELSATDKTARLNKFQSHLKPKGEAFTKPKWIARSAQGARSAAGEASTEKKAAAPKKKAAAATGAAKTKKTTTSKKKD